MVRKTGILPNNEISELCGLKGRIIQKRRGFPGGLVVMHLPASARDRGSIPGPRSPS